VTIFSSGTPVCYLCDVREWHEDYTQG
jgi:hypothetical protein